MRTRILSFLLVCGLVAGCASQRTTTEATPVPATRLANAADKFLKSGDVTLRYRDIGTGDPVVLLHGYTRSLEDWIGLADSLALNHRVIALDLRGFGQSSKFADPARFGIEMANDVIRLLDNLRIRRAHLAGHSMGAVIAANIAARHSERVITTSLIAGPFYPDSALFAQRLAPWVADLQRGAGLGAFIQWIFPGTPDSVAAQVNREIMAGNDSASLVAVMQSMGALIVKRERGASPVLSLVAVGTTDPLLPQSREFAAWWPGSRLVEAAGANHGDVVSRPEVLAAIRALIRARTNSNPGYGLRPVTWTLALMPGS